MQNQQNQQQLIMPQQQLQESQSAQTQPQGQPDEQKDKQDQKAAVQQQPELDPTEQQILELQQQIDMINEAQSLQMANNQGQIQYQTMVMGQPQQKEEQQVPQGLPQQVQVNALDPANMQPPEQQQDNSGQPQPVDVKLEAQAEQSMQLKNAIQL